MKNSNFGNLYNSAPRVTAYKKNTTEEEIMSL